MSTYPVPNTNADRIADFIEENPLCTRYAIAKATNLHQSTVDRAVTALVRHKVVFAQKDENGHQRYTHIDQIDD